jgi:23S rRNA (adenine2030-N6)-methyltransferase
MLSYRHGFHAGNFADVLKHAVLTLCLRALHRKDKPYCYIETHAGAGRYDLSGRMASKNAEFRNGIARLWDRSDLPALLLPYLDVVRALNRSGDLRWYPGSPLIVRSLLRPRDRMALCELHPTDIVHLTELFAHDRQVTVHHRDGYAALKALLPPAERRGLVLCDPSFEMKGERGRLVDALKLAFRKWPTGIFALWHPIQDRAATDRLYRQLKDTGIPKILAVELWVLPDAATMSLKGSGMILINPPWQIDEEVEALLPWLWETLAHDGLGQWRIEWLIRE